MANLINTNGIYGLTAMDIINITHPVGSLYWSTNPTHPNELFGGDWEQIKDRFVLACGEQYVSGETGGRRTLRLI